MVGMAVSKQDRFGACSCAKSCFGRFEDLICSSGNAGIDQSPRAAGSTHKIDVGEANWEPAEIGSYASNGAHQRLQGEAFLLYCEALSEECGCSAVAQTSEPAVSRISESAKLGRCSRPADWKSATQQT